MKRKITAKILIALSCISLMMPFYFTKEVKADENNDYIVRITVGESETYIEEDPEDNRYYIAKKYISFNYGEPCLGFYYISLGTLSAYAAGSVSEPSLFSFNGAYTTEVTYIEDSTWGYSFRIDFENLTQNFLLFQYKVLKTVYDAHPFEFIYEGITWDDGNITENRTGLIPIYLESINTTLDYIMINNNLSQQQVESYLQQINQNYLPTIIDMLQTIHGAIQTNGSGQYESYIYCTPTARQNATAASTRYYPTYQRQSYFGDGFSINNDGYIVCNYDGYVILANNAYFYRYSNLNGSCDIYWRWQLNGTDTEGFNETMKQGSGGVTCGTTQILQVHQGDILRYAWNILYSSTMSYMESSSVLVYYLSKDSTLDYSGQLSTIIQKEQLIYEALQDIKELIPTDVQQESITNINTELNINNEIVNTITNNYNTQFEDLNEQLDFDDLIDIDPESEHNILNDVSFYNTTFEGLINIPYMKSILIFLLLCILIVALVG